MAKQTMRDRNLSRKLQGWALIVIGVILMATTGDVTAIEVLIVVGGIALLVVAALRRPAEVDPPATD